MQQLHLVGFTTDLDSLIFSARKGAKSGSFVLSLDEALLATIADAVRRRVADGEELEVPAELLAPVPMPRRQSHLSPREIQDRLRSGRSLEAIAAEAGVGEEWVARFAAPVEAERSQVVGRARELVYVKPRRGESAEALGLAVRWNLAERGVRLTNDEFDGCWSAYQVADHTWSVTFTFVSRKRTQEAEWEVDLATGELIGRGRLASDLGYVEPGRRRRSLSSLQPMPLLGTKGGRRIGSAASNGTGGVSSAGPDDDEVDDDGREVAPARRSGGGRPAARKAAAKKASTRRAPAKKAVAAPARKAAGSAGRTVKAATKATAGRTTAKKAAAGRGAAKKAAPGRAVAAKRPAARAGGAAKKASTATKRAGGRPVAKKAAAGGRRAPAKKATATRKAAGRGSGSRGVPPEATPPAVERPVPNELGQRRLQLVTGAPRPTGSGRPGGAPGRRPAAAPAPAPVRIAAARSTDAVRRPAPAPVATAAERAPAPVATPAPAPAPEQAAPTRPAAVQAALDVVDEAAADARRAERRAERRAARAASANTGGGRDPGRETARGAPTADLPAGDGRVVTIRANRATPPTATGAEEGEVILPADRPPLRPAQPASQPRRRRFGRTDR